MATTLGVVGLAGTAFAHIEPDPAAAQEGASVTVGFMVEHGCAGSPTTGLDIKLPDGVADATAVEKPGWTATVDGGVVRFVGQSPSGEESDTFSITFTAPSTPGEVHFPTVQKCLTGSTDWLDVAQEGQPEPEHPAPTMTITAGPPSSADLTPPPDDGSDEAPAGATSPTEVRATSPATSAVTVPLNTAIITDTTSAPSKGGDSNTGLVVGIVIAVVVALVGGGVIGAMRARNRRTRR